MLPELISYHYATPSVPLHGMLIRRWQMIEPRCFPCSLRARYGTDKTRNSFHGSDSPESASREIRFFFPGSSEPIPSHATGELRTAQDNAKPSKSSKATKDSVSSASRKNRQLNPGASITAEDLDGLSKDEIAQAVLKMAAELGEDIDAVVDRLNSKPPRPADRDEL